MLSLRDFAPRAAPPKGDTFEINCSTRVEFDNYKASYLRM